MNAGTYCIVASGRGPASRELDIVVDAVKEIKSTHKEMTICACLGILKPEQAARLKEAGSTVTIIISIRQAATIPILRLHIHMMIVSTRWKR